MSAESYDKQNALLIAKTLNCTQGNCEPPLDAPFHMQDVWNLSDFGFACTVTECIPGRYLRIRALKKLKSMTTNSFVIKQIDKYLSDNTKWDSQIADNLAFDLRHLRKKRKEPT